MPLVGYARLLRGGLADDRLAGHYGLEWQWHFDVAAAGSYRFDLLAQATNSKQGMDDYSIEVSRDGAAWQPIGVVDQTTMTRFIWDLPGGDFAGSVTIRAVDSNQSDDPKRAN